jgi:autotransporter strand-loop-strand O-heptosyltransferase
MFTPKLKVHCSYIGTTGYNHHSRDFFRKLSEKIDLKIRNFTIGKSWKGNNDEPHNGEPYLNDTDKRLLEEQVLWTSKNTRDNFLIYTKHKNEFEHNIDLVLNETDHYFFYDSYDKPKIAYNVWESTLQPSQFFDKLLEYDQIWVPSQWQADCTIKQGADPNKVKVIPEGVDIDTFKPAPFTKKLDYKDGRFKFILFGRWDYRKSTKEIIETFLKEFDPTEPIDLIVSIDNPFSGDGHETTEKRLEHYGFTDKRIKVKHFPSREDYITYLKNGHVFVSCARSEGWNLPLIEAMACGTPSIYSACSGQMEFAQGKGLPVKILGEKPVMDADYNHFNSSVGNYYEPDFRDLARVMRDAFENYTDHKKRAVEEAKLIHRDFNWNKVAEIGNQTLQDFITNLKNEIIISFVDGAKCEIKGPLDQEYQVKFYNDDTNELVWEDTIKNNMWTAPNYKSFIKWRIEIWKESNKIHEHTLDLTNKKVYIHLDSKSIGDTLAWFPYIEEFRKKHNCKIYCSTFHNDWFKSQYSKIQFVEPGTSVGDLYSSYGIGWFYDEENYNKSAHLSDFKFQPLQKTASDILGLEYKELIPEIKELPPSPIKEKYVTISVQSTSQAKYWNHPTGWEQVVKHLQSKGYKIAVVDQHRTFGTHGFMNTSPKCDYHFHNKSLDEVMSVIKGAEFHIGIGSGLSWVAWTLKTPVMLISSFSRPWCEFQTNCSRVYIDSPTSGYFNTHKMDPSNWNWYPFKEIKSMEDWYEIETITPDLVIQEIDRIL